MFVERDYDSGHQDHPTHLASSPTRKQACQRSRGDAPTRKRRAVGYSEHDEGDLRRAKRQNLPAKRRDYWGFAHDIAVGDKVLIISHHTARRMNRVWCLRRRTY